MGKLHILYTDIKFMMCEILEFGGVFFFFFISFPSRLHRKIAGRRLKHAWELVFEFPSLFKLPKQKTQALVLQDFVLL